MLISILSFLHNTTTLLFGVYISAAFLGIRMNRKNILTLLSFSLVTGVIYILSYVFLGFSGTEKVYPLIIHLPLVLFLTFYYKYKFSLSVLSVLTAYLCCEISNWMGIAAMNIRHSEIVYYSVRIVVTVTVFILLIRYISDATARLLEKPTKAIFILGMMPFVYYVFDYVVSVYTELLYSGHEAVTEFLAFILCIFYIIFIFLYFKQYEERIEAEQRNRLMKIQQTYSKKEIEAIRRSERSIAILRHDMRHFLTNLSVLIDNGEAEKAQEYINGIINSADKTVNKRYCANDTVNMILSSYEDIISENKIDFRYTLRLPEKLPFSDVDITSVLSNAMENAIHAVLPLGEAERIIELSIIEKNEKILMSLSNTYAVKPRMSDGFPVTDDKNHGFGTQSIRYAIENVNGNCQFSVTDDRFILQIVL